METVTETPAEKAKRLGVKLISPLPELPQPTKEKEEPYGLDVKAKEVLHKLLTEPVAVCGVCGKEITAAQEYHREPCGGSRCPFGEWKM